MEKRTFKKGKNLAGGSSKFRAWNKFSVGDELVVRYLDQGTDAYGKPSYRCECLDAKFVNEDAKPYINGTITLNSTGMLDKAMQDIQPGMLFMVTYNGKVKIQKGPYQGKDSHTMDVDLVEEENSAKGPAPMMTGNVVVDQAAARQYAPPSGEPAFDQEEDDFF